MTQQDDITQRGLTDDELMALLPGAVRLPPGWIDTARAIQSALLSKLRAEGVPVAGMPEYITDNRYHIQYRLGWNNCLSDCRAAMLNTAPVASAPADERALQEYGSPADVARRIEQYLAQDGRMNSGTQLLYESMKALRSLAREAK